MQDKLTLERIQLLHPKLRDEAGEIYKAIGEVLSGKAACRFTSTLRTFAEQAALHAKGRSAPGKIVTNARAGTSYHNYGLAIDIVLLIDRNGDGIYEEASWDTKGDFDGDSIADWMEIVAIFKQYGWEWGGDWRFKDTPHFQKTIGYSVRQLLEKYNAKKLIPNTNYVNI
jgi:peptidoglycan L-alanyl-D-glutamate endopeptidase CwlK